jgi:hypothetical protein
MLGLFLMVQHLNCGAIVDLSADTAIGMTETEIAVSAKS